MSQMPPTAAAAVAAKILLKSECIPHRTIHLCTTMLSTRTAVQYPVPQKLLINDACQRNQRCEMKEHGAGFWGENLVANSEETRLRRRLDSGIYPSCWGGIVVTQMHPWSDQEKTDPISALMPIAHETMSAVRRSKPPNCRRALRLFKPPRAMK